MKINPLWKSAVFQIVCLTGAAFCAVGSTSVFTGWEYQDFSNSGDPSGTVRSGDPADDPVFAAWLGTAGMTTADLSPVLGAGPAAVWGRVTTPAAGVSSITFNVGNTPVTASISGWNDTSQEPAVSGAARLSTFGLDGTSLQDNAPRPGFASGLDSGYYIGTTGGNTADTIRNGVSFDLSGFEGGGVYAFGIFGGDLETGAPGSPMGFLRITFTDNSTIVIPYEPDPALFVDAEWDGNNNVSETYGNETSRFIGISSDDKLIKNALFVVGDDDLNDNGSSEHLSFIAGGVTFLDASGRPVRPANVPEPGAAVFLLTCGLLAAGGRRRRKAAGVAGNTPV